MAVCPLCLRHTDQWPLRIRFTILLHWQVAIKIIPPTQKKTGIFSFYPHSHCYCNIASTSQACTCYQQHCVPSVWVTGFHPYARWRNDPSRLRVHTFLHNASKRRRGGGRREKLSRVIVPNVQMDTNATPEIRSGTSATRNLRAQLPHRNDRWQRRPIMIIILIGLLMNVWRLRSGRPGIPQKGLKKRRYIINRAMKTRTTD
jgi:hypothetical protein